MKTRIKNIGRDVLCCGMAGLVSSVLYFSPISKSYAQETEYSQNIKPEVQKLDETSNLSFEDFLELKEKELDEREEKKEKNHLQKERGYKEGKIEKEEVKKNYETDHLISLDTSQNKAELNLNAYNGNLSVRIGEKEVEEVQLNYDFKIRDNVSFFLGALSEKLGRISRERLVKLGIKYISGKKVKNETKVKTGFFSDNIGNNNSEEQFLLGLEDRLYLPLFKSDRTDLIGEAGGDIVYSLPKGKLLFDSYALEARLNYKFKLSNKLTWYNTIGYHHLDVNTNKYFFLDKAEKKGATTALEWRRDTTGIAALATLEKSRDDKELPELLRKRFGLHIETFDWLIKNYFEKDNSNLKHKRYLLSIGKKIGRKKNKLVEIFYNREELLKGHADIIGINFSIPYGKPKDIQDDFENYVPREGIYALTGNKDYGLPFEENTWLNSIRKINEYSSNLEQTEGLDPPRTPSEVEKSGGDCDELANWFSYRAVQQGYKAHVLNYLPISKDYAHAISLVEAKNEELFVNMYGRFFKVDVPKNASEHEKVRAALNQIFTYSASVPKNGEIVSYKLYNPSSGNYLKNNPVLLGNMGAEPTKPHIENGIRALIGNRF